MHETENILTAIPVRDCEYEVSDGVTVLLVYKKPSFIEKIFFKKLAGKPMKIDLDEIGSFIWSLIDGATNVELIIRKTSEHFGESVEPVEERVSLFIRELNKNRYIKLYKKVQNN